MNVGKKFIGKKVFILTTNKRSYQAIVLDADDDFIYFSNGIKQIAIRISTIEEIKEEE